MEQLIKIERSEGGKQVCSARETYIALGLDVTNWAKWYKSNITNNPYVIENEDWALLVPATSDQKKGQFAQDFAITIDFAKRIAMMAKTEKGEEVRKYFIECERIVKNELSQKLPTTYLDALKELVAKEEQVLLLEEKNEKLQFRSDFVDVCFDTDGVFSMEEVSKILKLPYGRNKMMDKLRKAGVLLSSNTPKQGMIKNGYFKVVETMVQNGDFKKLVSTTYATQKGIGHIHKILNK